MKWWDEKMKVLKGAVDKEKNSSKPSKSSLCIHGEENCIRCVAEDFQSQLDSTVWRSLEDADIKRVIYTLPSKVVEFLRRNPGRTVIAGGFIRAVIGNETINDIDIFINEGNPLSLEPLVKGEFKDKHIEITEEGKEIQIIWRYPYKEPYEILEQFDYTVVKAAIWFDEGDKKHPANFVSICHERFYQDLARKMLVYDCDRNTERIQSIPRLLKYTTYGYSIDAVNLANVIVRTCLSLDLTNGFEGAKKQLEGCYKPSGQGQDWTLMTKKYVKPVERTRDYGYGS